MTEILMTPFNLLSNQARRLRKDAASAIDQAERIEEDAKHYRQAAKEKVAIAEEMEAAAAQLLGPTPEAVNVD